MSGLTQPPQMETPPPDHWRARALIDADALRHNLARVRELAPGCRVMAVIKSNAYGHGMAAVSREIGARVDGFAVATLQEGIDCRRANPSTPVTVLSGLQQPDALDLCRRHRLDPVLHDLEHLRWLEHYRGAPLDPWLKIDTGMNRLGIAPARTGDAVARLRRNPRVGSIRLMSHLANADDGEDDYSAVQLKRFNLATAAHEMERSLANSAGVMRAPQTHFEWVRPGIMLYGGSPLRGHLGAQLGLRPVMQLEARLLAVKRVAKGQPVGYGGDFVAPNALRLGVVGFGYGDGYPRLLGADAAALVGGVRAPLIGRVSMDMLALDVSDCADADIGRRVVLWGRGLGVDEVANWAGTISYELLCKVSERVARITTTTTTTVDAANGET